MSTPNGHPHRRPRHLEDVTAELRVIGLGRHHRPSTGELRAQPARPVPLWAQEDGKLHATPSPAGHRLPAGLRGSWWRRLVGWLRRR